MESWEPTRREEESELGRWLVEGHEVALLQHVVHERKYPWREEIARTEWMAVCATCREGTRFLWQGSHEAAIHDLENHIENAACFRHATFILDDAKSHQERLK